MLTLEQAVTLQRTYRAHEKYREPLENTTLVAAVGATAVGKNFLMEKSGLPVVGTLTTREPRATDDPSRYRYTDLSEMLHKIEQGEVVQYGAHPPHVYASELQDYVLDEPNISDIYYHSVSELENKGFKSVKAISILTSKEQWMSQLWERFEGMHVGTVYARLVEARQSLRWTRAQALGAHAANHLVIINTAHSIGENEAGNDENDSNSIEKNVARIRDFASGVYVQPPDAETVRRYAEGMEQAIDIVQSRLTV